MAEESKGQQPDLKDGQTPEANGQQTEGEPEVSPETPVDVPSLPVNVQNLIRVTREDAAKQRKRVEALEADASKAQEKQLEANQKWEELATQRGEQLAGLDGVIEQRDEYQKQLVSSLTAQIADWPEEFKDMVPDSEDPAVIQAFITKAKPAVDKFNATTAPPGVGSTPKPMGQPGQLTPEQEKVRKDSFATWVRRL